MENSGKAGFWHVPSGTSRHPGDDASVLLYGQPASSSPSSSFFGRMLAQRISKRPAGHDHSSYICIMYRSGSLVHEEDRRAAAAAERSARPSKIDWVEAGVVSSIIRNQNDCGCCWAMAAVASVEALHYLKTTQSVSLSVQELIDCATTNNGCNGGHPERALAYIQKYGLSSESSYPYIASRSTSGCKKDRTLAAKISGFQRVGCNEDALEKAVAKQPVVVRLQYTTDLWNYKRGIMEYESFPSTTTNQGHFVLIVGYGTDPDGTKYWRFKNSWGESRPVSRIRGPRCDLQNGF